MRKIRIADIKAAAASRPDGYVDDIMGRGRVVGDTLILEEPDYQAVMHKYSAGRPGCCEASELSRARFLVCGACPDSTDGGFGCRHHKGCCFGRWRGLPASQCPKMKW